MPRYALELEYDGTGFVGWQAQDNGVSVQSVLEAAAERLARGGRVATVAAGRTDAGVHATGQVAQLDLPVAHAPATLQGALNFHLRPHKVVVLRAALADDTWNARFSAVARVYVYRILNRRAPPALLADRVWHVPHALDADSMHAAAQALLGRHDFSSFRAVACQADSPLRTLDRLDVTRDGGFVEVHAQARSFLHHQVRNMVGTLKLVGEGRWPAARMAEVLAARNRAQAGPTAPASGLTLVAVRYPSDPFAT